MSRITEAIEQADEREAARQREFEALRRQHGREKVSAEPLLSCSVPATPREYADWLALWIANGGEISHVYDYPMRHHRWLTLQERPASVPALHGARAVHVIVPEHVELTPADLSDAGHSNFYFMDGARCWRGLWVPLFTDVRAVLEQDTAERVKALKALPAGPQQRHGMEQSQ